ncbi:MAG: ChbG/HpnK family deacetylase [Nitrospiraceae bacterium]|nr:ChbG/HpnK family deacetylase [Nitrospiraceae bacterium]
MKIVKLCAVDEPAYLIVNADDYGYFSCISRGILDGGENGLITATGVIANSHNFSEHLHRLKAAAYLDAGVHLNLSYGRPLTNRMERKLGKRGGKFPGKYPVLFELLTGKLTIEDILEEWRAQIWRCTDAGLKIYFLNTHEHLHAFPALFEAIMLLKKEYKVPYIRFPEPEWDAWGGARGMVRNALLQCIRGLNRFSAPEDAPRVLGISNSGKLTRAYLKKRLLSLEKGKIYELMCHPGYFDPAEIKDKRLRSYHRWEQELELLKSQEVRGLCNARGVRVVRYSDLQGKPRA